MLFVRRSMSRKKMCIGRNFRLVHVLTNNRGVKVKNKKLELAALTAAFVFSFVSYGNETASEKVNTKANQAADGFNSVGRDAEDAVCPLVNGKVECTGKKAKNKAQKAADRAGTRIKELKDKAD